MDPSLVCGLNAGAGTARAGRKRVGTDADRRRQVMDAAEMMFLAKGFHRTTMAEIARSASMSKKTIYQVFVSKDDLLDAVLSRRKDTLTRPLDPASDDRPPAEVLTELLLQLAHFVFAPAEIAFARLLIADAMVGDTVVQALDRQGFFVGRTTLAQWLARQAASGALCIGCPQEAAEMLVGMVLGELHIRLMMRTMSELPEALVAQRVDRAVALFLAATTKGLIF